MGFLPLVLVASPALAADLSTPEARAALREAAAGHLALSADVRTVDRVVVDEAAGRAELGPGVVRAVVVGDRVVGYAFEGQGKGEARFLDRWDAVAWADRQVLFRHAAPDDVAAFAKGAPVPFSLTRALVLQPTGDVAGWFEKLPAASGGDFGWTEMPLHQTDLDGPVRRAMLAGDLAPSWTYVIADTDRAWGACDGAADRRLAWFASEAGWDERLTDGLQLRCDDTSIVTYSGATLPPAPGDPVRAPVRPARVEPEEAAVDVTLTSSATQIAAEIDVRMTVRAHGDVGWGRVDVPGTDGAVVEALEAGDGSAITPWDPRDGKGSRHPSVWWGLHDGDTEVVHVRWRDTWPVPAAGGSTGLRTVVPSVGPSANRDGFALRMTTRWDRSLQVAQSGVTTSSTAMSVSSEDDAARAARLVAGRWAVDRDVPATGAVPALRVHVNGADDADALTGVLAQAFGWASGLLPAAPVGEVEVYQNETQPHTIRWSTDRGLVSFQKMDSESDDPDLGTELVVTSVVSQWWGSRAAPATYHDEWLARAPDAWYSVRYLEGAFGADVARTWWTRWSEDVARAGRRTALAPVDGDGTPTEQVSEREYGALVLRLVDARIGDEAFLRAMAALAGQPTVTTEAFEDAVRASSGQPLPDLELWLRGGFVPAFNATWTKTSTGADVVVGDGVPFGTLSVPVRVTFADRTTRDAWVDVVDGVGRLTVTGDVAGVKLDPDGLVPSQSLRVTKAR